MVGHTGYVTGIVFSPDSSRLASYAEDNTVRIWNASDAIAIGQPMVGDNGFFEIRHFSLPTSPFLQAVRKTRR